MDFEMTTCLIIGLILGMVIGIMLTYVFSPKSLKYNQMKRDLDLIKRKLINQKRLIVKHFFHSAEILDNMAKEFCQHHQMMKENSNQLISQENFDSVKENQKENSYKNNGLDAEIDLNQTQQNDYVGVSSGLLNNAINES